MSCIRRPGCGSEVRSSLNPGTSAQSVSSHEDAITLACSSSVAVIVSAATLTERCPRGEASARGTATPGQGLVRRSPVGYYQDLYRSVECLPGPPQRLCAPSCQLLERDTGPCRSRRSQAVTEAPADRPWTQQNPGCPPGVLLCCPHTADNLWNCVRIQAHWIHEFLLALLSL